MYPLHIIAAVDEKFGIGREGRLPWHLAGDLRHFKEVTTATHSPNNRNAVIVGRKTWESLPAGFRPLPGRVNCVLSRQETLVLPTGVLQGVSLEDGLLLIDEACGESVEQVFVIGGSQVFPEAVRHPNLAKLFLTRILKDFHCDVFFPVDLERFIQISEGAVVSEGDVRYFFAEYEIRH